jgi:hypothetical protein
MRGHVIVIEHPRQQRARMGAALLVASHGDGRARGSPGPGAGPGYPLVAGQGLLPRELTAAGGAEAEIDAIRP